MSRFVVVVIASAVASFAVPADAQVEGSGPRQPPRVVIDMTEDVIEATPARPTVTAVIAATGKRPHKSLIRLRSDFRAEVLGSVGAL